MLVRVILLITFFITFAAGNIFEYEVKDADGNIVSLDKYTDAKAILIVNVASRCGFTHTNYRQLREMYNSYHDKGLEILGFPSNQFGEQEPGTDKEIQNFCTGYGVQFPIFAKINVNGADAHPLYKYLKTATDGTEIGWNFAKFLVVDGEPVQRYNPRIAPKSIEEDILYYLEGEEDGNDSQQQEL